MKKYSNREKRLLRLMIAAIAIGAFAEGYDRFSKSKDEMLTRIETEKIAQDVYWQKLDVDEDRLLNEIKRFDEILHDSQDRVLHMPGESDAIFKVQELLAKIGEKAKIGMNSQNKRKSAVVSEEKGITELKTYFGYDCSLADLLIFFEMLKEQPYYYAVDTLNINSYQRRRSRRPKKEADPNIDRIRGSMVISTLFSPGEGEFIAIEVEPRDRFEMAMDDEGDDEGLEEPTEPNAKVSDEGEEPETPVRIEMTKRPKNTESLSQQILGDRRPGSRDGPAPISDEGKEPQEETRPITSKAQRMEKIKTLGQKPPSKAKREED